MAHLNPSIICIIYDSTVRAYSKDHLPFAIFSVCIVLVFVVLPTFLLILYPIFRMCITCCDLGDSMHHTLSWKHFRDTKRMEPMVHGTSEEFLHCNLSSGWLCWSPLQVIIAIPLMLMFG